MDGRSTVIGIARRSDAVKVCNREEPGATADATARACTQVLNRGAPNRNRRGQRPSTDAVGASRRPPLMLELDEGG
jgi:hypothetical protein